MNGLRLTPEESTRFREVADKLDGYADGVRVAVEYVKQQAVRQILADRQVAAPKEDSSNGN